MKTIIIITIALTLASCGKKIDRSPAIVEPCKTKTELVSACIQEYVVNGSDTATVEEQLMNLEGQTEFCQMKYERLEDNKCYKKGELNE